MMKILVTALLPLCVLSVERPKDVEAAACSSYGLPVENEMTYHGDQVCDRSSFNLYKERLERYKIHRRLMEGNEINRVPNQKTVHCPLEVQDLMQEGQEAYVNGFDSVWIVENTSKEPVVLSFVEKDGIEYSALNPSITPPQNDPHAILKPNNWRALAAWDGHVFHARTFDAETGNLGPVVMQHRLGLIPVGAKFQDLVCPEDDPEPMIDNVPDPNFSRTPPKVNRPCNTIDIGFRNMANCPLHGYYMWSNETSCQEKFKFHLGKNYQPKDFMWQWDSPTKFEGSFVGHSFAFRSAANPEILIETVTLQPSRVVDCPELKNKAQINKVTKVGEFVEVSLPITNNGDVATREQHLKDTLLRVDRRVLASVFNQTHGMNSTAPTQRRHSRSSLLGSPRSPMVGVDSF